MERTIEKELGKRFNDGKTRYDLLPPNAIDELAKVFTMGQEKYGAHNWEKGLSWESVIASLKRHVAAFEACEDFDKESGLKHIAHVMANAAMLCEFYKIYPQGDDRVKPIFTQPKIVLDIDEVLADFLGAYGEKYGVDSKTKYWNFTYKMSEHLEELKNDKDFWLNIKPLRELPFEPHAYCTSRIIPSEWTEEWLEKNGYPCRPVHTVPVGASKVETLKKLGCEIFVDDSFNNFKECNQAGIFTYLMDTPHNQQYNVGHQRVYDLHILNF